MFSDIFSILILSLGLQAQSNQPVFHQQDKSVKTCPEEVSEIAQEYLILEMAGRRSLKADDNCFKSVKTKYVSLLKDPDEFKNEVLEVSSGTIKNISFNKEYQQYDVKIELKTSKGKKVMDSFRFMKLGKPGKPKPGSGCGLLSARTKNALVLEKCMP